MTILELKEKREGLVTELDERLKGFESAPDTYTEEEIEKSSSMQDQIDQLSKSIKLEEKKADLAQRAIDRAHARDAAGGTPEGSLLKNFSLQKFIRSQLPNQKMEGAELEAHQEAVKEFSKMNVDLGNQIGIPSFMMATEKDIVVGTGTAGGDAVQTDVNKIIPFLRVRLTAEKLGATVLRNLKGDQKFPRRDNSPASGWLSETGTAGEISPTIDFFSMTPHRNGAFIEASTQSILQMNTDVENLMRDELSFQVKKSVDIAAFNGSGAGDIPLGLLNTPNIGDVSHGTDGGAPTWAKTLEFLTTLYTNNAEDDMIKWAMTPGVLGKMMSVEKATNTGNFIVNEPGKSLLGSSITWTNNLPTDGAKGNGTALHAAILGHWPDLFIGQWGGISLLVDPYTRGKDGIVTIIVNSYWDIGVRQPGAFAAATDIDIT